MKKESRENWTTVHRTKEKHGLLAGRATMGGKAFYITAGELADRGFEAMPDEMVSGKGLIFSSPATLSYNSPGAQGFGVKRAGLVIPESVMLLVAPACCGRNTTILGDMGGYSHRTFFLEMDENDLVTGRQGGAYLYVRSHQRRKKSPYGCSEGEYLQSSGETSGENKND